MIRIVVAALAGALAVMSALPATAAPMDDKLFVATVIGINMEEIQMGQLAQQKSTNPAVKAFGMTLVNDHTKANTQATALAMKIGATVPTALSPDAKKMFDSLSAMSGPAFDKMFADGMAMGHTMAIQLFMDQSASTNTDVASFAKMTLPTLQAHLATAQALQKAGSST